STDPIDVRSIRVCEILPAPPNAFRRVMQTPEGLSVFENRRALPRFRFASRLRPAQNVEEAVALMDDPKFDPASDAIVEGIAAPAEAAPGTILAEQIGNERLEWDLETGEKSFLVVADAFFPGWHASVDGRAAPILPVDGCLRGVNIVGAGRHHVVMTFRP